MEVFTVNKCTDEVIDLKSEKQLESLLEKIKDSQEILIRWTEYTPDDDVETKRSKILITDNIMSRIKDGRFSLTSSVEVEEE